MNDLVDQFEKLLDAYRQASELWKDALLALDGEGQKTAKFAAKSAALDICDFLLEHGPTVTFDAPAEPSAAAFEPQYVWDNERRNWFRKEGADDGC